MKKSITYADAGVDIEKADRMVSTIKKIASKTNIPGVIGGIGGFGGLFAPNVAGMKEPVLVSSTDGVGTKLKIAFMMNKHDTLGIDLVAMCVNDIAVSGAKPLFFLDYISMGVLDTAVAEDIISGVAEGCRMAGCALSGGETAEMPGLYSAGEYDLAGFSVGLSDREKIIDGANMAAGDQIIGIASSGLHSNGYSLARKICFDELKMAIDDPGPEPGKTIGEELLTPTRIYVSTIQNLIADFPVHGLAHITGGGLSDNIIRVAPEAYRVVIRRKSWETHPIFTFLKEAGHVSETEMMRTFNNGIGLAVIVPKETVEPMLARLKERDEIGFLIGEIAPSTKTGQRVEWVD